MGTWRCVPSAGGTTLRRSSRDQAVCCSHPEAERVAHLRGHQYATVVETGLAQGEGCQGLQLNDDGFGP